MRTTLAIDDDVLEEVRQIASVEGRSVGAVLSSLARRSLVPVGIDSSGDVPVFDVPADAPRITSADVSKALEEE